MPITGNKHRNTRSVNSISDRGSRNNTGFTLLEILVVLGILALTLSVASPMAYKVFESMQYRSAVKDLVSMLSVARAEAITSGTYRDIEIRPDSREITIDRSLKELPKQVTVEVISARELSRAGVGVIRFYPDGSSSGGAIELSRVRDQDATFTTSIQVDWLLGRISQVRQP